MSNISRVLPAALALALALAGSCKSKSGGEQEAPAASNAKVQSTEAEAIEAPPENNYQLEGSGPELYERILVPPLFAPWADDLLQRAALEEGQRVLDVATGTGIVARKAAPTVGASGQVVGLDISPAMLEVARTTDATIEWVEGDAQELPMDDASFDVVLCQQGLQFFPDRATAAREMHRVLRPGGRALVSVWRGTDRNPYAGAFARAVGERVSAEARTESESPFAWDDAAELESILAAAGFESVEVQSVTLEMTEDDLPAFIVNDLLAYPTLGKTLAGWDNEEKDALVAEILAALSQHKKDDAWTIAWTAHVATARKAE